MTTVTCTNCGHQFDATLLRPENRVDGAIVCWNCLMPNQNERWKVTVHWKGGSPTIAEVMHLRSVFAQFQEVSAKELWQSLKDKSKHFVGTFHKPHLDRIIDHNEHCGLELEIQSTLDDRPSSSPFNRIQRAIQRDDADQVSQLIQQLHNPNQLTDEGTDLLTYAINVGGHQSAIVLIRSGITLANRKSSHTAMQSALENGADQITDELLEHDIDLNVQGTQEMESALHLLCRNYRSAQLLQRFLENGADPQAKNHLGETPLSILEQAPPDNDPSVIRVMIDQLRKAIA